MSKLEKARDSADEVIKKYKIWRNKVVQEPKYQNIKAKTSGAVVYELFIKDAIESKIDGFIPTIKVKNEQSNLYDFRLQNELEHEKSESNLATYEELDASPGNTTVSNTDKSINRSKTVLVKPTNAKSNDKADITTLNTKLYVQTKVKKDIQMLKVKSAVQPKEENHGKQAAQRTLHKQNWARSDSKMKPMKSETAKDKPVVRNIGIPSKNKKLQVIQPVSNITVTPENNMQERKKNSSTLYIEEKETEKEISNNQLSETENVSEVQLEKSNGTDLLQDEEPKIVKNLLHETRTPALNVISTDKPDKHLKLLEPQEINIDNVEGTLAPNAKVETESLESFGKSNTLCDLKPNINNDEPNAIRDSLTPTDGRFAQGRNVDINDSQINNQNKMLQMAAKNMNEQSFSSDLTQPLTPKIKSKNILTTLNKSDQENANIFDNNKLKTTYLVSFEVKEDEAFLKTRTQVVADEIKGDSIDLDIVLEEEKKAREGRKFKRLPENIKGTYNDVNVLLGSNKSDLQLKDKAVAPSSLDKHMENRKINATPTLKQEVATQPLRNNLSAIKDIGSFNSNPTHYRNNNDQALKRNNIVDDNLVNKKDNDMTKDAKMLEHKMKIKMNKNVNDPANAEVTFSEINSEQNNDRNKSQSLTPLRQGKKEKVIDNKDVNVLEKEKHLLSSTPDNKKVNTLHKSKELKRSEKYQEIIDSVKKIIPSSESNESILGRKTQKIELTGTKTINTENISKNYSKTINELKDIINELPEGDIQQVIAVPKYRNIREKENKNNKSSEKFSKNTKEESIAFKDEVLDGKQTNINTSDKSRPKRINLRKIKVIDNNAKGNQEEKSISLENNNIEESLPPDQEKTENKLKPPKSNTSISMKEYKKLDSQTENKECLEEISSNLSPKNNKKNPLNLKILSNLSDRNAEKAPIAQEILKERTHKGKTSTNLKFNEKKLEASAEPEKQNDATKNFKLKEIDQNPTAMRVPNTTVKTKDKYEGENATNMTEDKSLVMSKDLKPVKSSEFEIEKTSTKERATSHGRIKDKNLKNKFTHSEVIFQEEGSRESSKIIKAKSDVSISKTSTPSIKGQKRINVSSEMNKSGIIDPSQTTSRKLPQKTKGGESVKSSENKAREQFNATLKENEISVPAKTGNKTNSGNNEKIKLPIEQFLKSTKNSFVNQKKVIKFTRSNETVVRKNTSSENNLLKIEKKGISEENSIKLKPLRGMETLDKPIPSVEVMQQKPSKILPNMLQDKNKNPGKMKKEIMQPTGIMAKRTLKVKVISNVKPKRNNPSSQLTGGGVTLPKIRIQNSMQVNNNDRLDEPPNVSRRVENR